MKKQFLLGLLLLSATSAFGAQISAGHIKQSVLALNAIVPNLTQYIENDQGTPPAPQPTQKAGLADTIFNSNGAVENTIINDGVAIAALSDGGLVVVGTDSSSGYVAQYDKTGTIVSTFGTSGNLTLSSIVTPLGVVTDSDDNIYVVGKNATNLRVEKFDRFGTAASGFTVTALTSATSARGQIIYHDSALFVLGDNATNGFLYKLNATTGALDATFNSGAVLDLGVNFDVNVGLAGLGNYVYALGYNSGSSAASKIKKVAVGDGSLDSSYGTSGLAEVAVSGATAALTGLAVDSSGAAYVLGNGTSSVVGKIKADGSDLDTTWATSGIFSFGGTRIHQDIKLDYNGNLVFAGVDSSIAKIQKLVGGALDTNFGSNGTFSDSNATGGFKAVLVTANNDYIATGGDSSDTWIVKCTNGRAGTAAEQIAANAGSGGIGLVG